MAKRIFFFFFCFFLISLVSGVYADFSYANFSSYCNFTLIGDGTPGENACQKGTHSPGNGAPPGVIINGFLNLSTFSTVSFSFGFNSTGNRKADVMSCEIMINTTESPKSDTNFLWDVRSGFAGSHALRIADTSTVRNFIGATTTSMDVWSVGQEYIIKIVLDDTADKGYATTYHANNNSLYNNVSSPVSFVGGETTWNVIGFKMNDQGKASVRSFLCYNGTNMPAVKDAAAATLTFDVTLNDLYTGSAITAFNVTAWNETFREQLDTTNGTVSFLTRGNGSFNIAVDAPGYFNLSYFRVNSSLAFNSLVYQSIIIINATEKISGNPISSFTIWATSQRNVTTNGTAVLYVANGSYTINAASSGYTNSSVTVGTVLKGKVSANVTFGSSNLTILAYEFFTNATILNFTVTIVDLNGTTFSETGSSNNTGKLDFAVINRTFNVSINAKGYAISSANITVNSQTIIYKFSLHTENSVSATMLDEGGGTLLNGTTVSLLFDATGFYQTYSTSNGTLFVSNLPEGVYTLTASATGFATRQKSVNIITQSHHDVEFRLANLSSSLLRTFTVQDASGNNVNNVSMEFSRRQNGTYVLISTFYTDFAGEVQIALANNAEYKVVLTRSGFNSQEITVIPTSTTTAYTITLSEAAPTFSNDLGGWSYKLLPAQSAITYSNTSFNVTLSNPTSKVENWGIRAFTDINLCHNQNCESSGSSSVTQREIFVFLQNSSANEITIFMYFDIAGSSANVTINRTYSLTSISVPVNASAAGFFAKYKGEFPSYTREIIAVVLSAIVGISLAAYLSVVGVAAVILIGMIFFTVMGWIPIWHIGIVIALGIIVFFTEGRN